MLNRKKICGCLLILSLFLFSGCQKVSETTTTADLTTLQNTEDSTEMESAQDKTKLQESTQKESESQEEIQNKNTKPMIIEEDWSKYFQGLNGAAVLFDPTENTYQIYNKDLAVTRRSPCSTFKIVSSLVGLKTGVIVPEQSTREWSGEIFWNEDWNQDIDFKKAFQTSCVWYFREVIDEIGKETMQKELEQLQYGNCDISDWAGDLNNNNDNPVLTGFWIESSLKISPKEQVEVMERIFGEQSKYEEEIQDELKNVMLITEEHDTENEIYGKTGMGKSYGVVVDAWFTGFADIHGKRLYFCIYLGETEGADVSSTKAKEIAIQILDYESIDR